MALKDHIASWLLKWLMNHQPDALRTMIKADSDQKVESVALQTTMLYLDRMGLLHCALCPQRFGLRRASATDPMGRPMNSYLCTVHYLQTQNGNDKNLKVEAL